jgi:uncharacterized protein
MSTKPQRLDVIDCLRGFAIVSIMLLHNIEHFDLYFRPDGLPAWMAAIDKLIWDSLFFLFSGKSYAIFAMLFGVTFFIQLDKRAQRGEAFRLRFAWRMFLLLLFGLVNSLFYQGDILSYYAVLGLCLIPVARAGNKTVFALAVLCLLQPWEWMSFISALGDPGAKLANPASWTYFGLSETYLKGDSMLATWIGNITNGKIAAVRWSWENGRMFQIVALFMLGMLAGRQGLFVASEAARRFWKRTLFAAALCFMPLFWARSTMASLVPAEALRRPLETIVASWSNVSFMLVLVSGFVLLFQGGLFTRALRIFGPLGRMSLTSYVVQSMIGSTLYYGYGFALYKVTGASLCLAIGIALAVLQGLFSAWWLRHHKQGPLEALWHRATWWGRRPSPLPVTGDSDSGIGIGI